MEPAQRQRVLNRILRDHGSLTAYHAIIERQRFDLGYSALWSYFNRPDTLARSREATIDAFIRAQGLRGIDAPSRIIAIKRACGTFKAFFAEHVMGRAPENAWATRAYYFGTSTSDPWLEAIYARVVGGAPIILPHNDLLTEAYVLMQEVTRPRQRDNFVGAGVTRRSLLHACATGHVRKDQAPRFKQLTLLPRLQALRAFINGSTHAPMPPTAKRQFEQMLIDWEAVW